MSCDDHVTVVGGSCDCHVILQLEKKASSGRVNRAKLRRLASVFSTGDVSSDLAKYNQLKVRETHTHTPHSHTHTHDTHTNSLTHTTHTTHTHRRERSS